MAKGWRKKGKLDAAERHALPSSDFALPSKGAGKDGKGSGSYPVPDVSHARNALARVSANGTSAEKAAVRKKVAEKFPGIAMSRAEHRYRDRSQ